MKKVKCCPVSPPKVKCCRVSHKFSFASMIALTSTFFLVEIVVGYVTNSMALVADSFHMLSDVVSLLVGYAALRFSLVRQPTARYTFGWARAEVLGALVNAVFLIALCFSILVEALKRLVLPEHLGNPHLVLITGAIGLFVNLIGLCLFHDHSHSHSGHGHSHNHGGHGHSDDKEYSGNGVAVPILEKSGHSHNTGHCPNHDDKEYSGNGVVVPILETSKADEINDKTTALTPLHDDVMVKNESSSSQLNIRAVYLHVLGDALGSVIVVVSALLVIYGKGDWTRYVDPSLSIVMVIIILKTSFPLLKESAFILMQTVPDHIKLDEVEKRLVQRIPGVLSVHEFHVWQLAGNKIVASLHVHCKTLPEYMRIANQLKEFFHDEGIHSTTIQPEYAEPPPPECAGWEGVKKVVDCCVLECNEHCSDRTCCGSSSTQGSTQSGDGSVNSVSQGSTKNETESVQSISQTSEKLNGSDNSMSQSLMKNEDGTGELLSQGSLEIANGPVHSITQEEIQNGNGTVESPPGYQANRQDINKLV